MEDRKLQDFFRCLSIWLENQDHRPDCKFGQIVQSGPLAGNKLHCNCGLSALQGSIEDLSK